MCLAWQTESISNVGEQGMSWRQDGEGWCAGRKGWKEQRGRGRRGAELPEGVLRPTPKEFDLYELGFIAHLRPMTWTVCCKPRDGGEHYIGSVFRFLCACICVFFNMLLFWSNSRFIAKLRGGNRNLPYKLLAYKWKAFPPATLSTKVIYLLQLMNCTDYHYHPKWILYLGGRYWCTF